MATNAKVRGGGRTENSVELRKEGGMQGGGGGQVEQDWVSADKTGKNNLGFVVIIDWVAHFVFRCMMFSSS